MTRDKFWIVALLGLLFPALALAQENVKVGIVKGIITIEGKATSDAVVSVEGLPAGYLKSQMPKLRAKKAVLDQRDMKFLPRVLPVLVGTTVDFPNRDKSWHSVFSTSEAKRFDLGLYPPGKSRSVTFDKPGVVRILCNVHPAMEAYIVVLDHPFFTVPDTRGNYRINSVPLGGYRLKVWHPELGTRVVSFKLAQDGEVLEVDLDLKQQR